MTKTIVAAAYGGPDVLRQVDEELAAPGPGLVLIEVRAVGVNPVDYVGFSGAFGGDESRLPLPVGSELAGVIAAIGPDTQIATGGGAVGDPVLAFEVPGAYAEQVTAAACDVFAKPDRLDFAAAANLLLVGTTAADMLRVVPVAPGETVLVHGASGAVGVSLLQQLRPVGVQVLGTASERTFGTVHRFGARPVAYGPGLDQRIRDAAPGGIAAAFDCAGTDEAIDTSLALLDDRARLVTIAAHARAVTDSLTALPNGESVAYRRAVRPELVDRAARGDLVVPVARTWPLVQAADALAFLAGRHPGGKLALLP